MIEDLDAKTVSAALDALVADLRRLGMNDRADEIERLRKRPARRPPQTGPGDA